MNASAIAHTHDELRIATRVAVTLQSEVAVARLAIGAVALHVVIGASIAGDSAYAIGHVTQWSIWLEGARRIGIALYLLAISFGLASIITVLRFQSVRVRELAEEVPSEGAARLPT